MKPLPNLCLIQATTYLRDLGVVDRTAMFTCQCILRWKNSEGDLYDASIAEHLPCSQHK